MKNLKEFFSSVNKNMKPFVDKINKLFKLIYKKVKKLFSKFSNIYKIANKKNKYVEPIVVITTSCLIVLFFVLFLKNFKTIEEVDLAKNSAEVLYYENKYDEAIEEYTKMQEENEWPIWSAKIADLYSLRGEIDKSNNLLKEVIIKRDRIINEKGYDNYKDEDRELMNYVLLTFTLNKEYEDVISLGEDYIKQYGKDNKMISTLFLAYLASDKTSNAKDIIKEYEVNEGSACDLSYIANMKMMVNEYDEGLELLKKAFNIDKNELKIYDVIDNICSFDKESLINSLEENIKKTNDYEYNVFLAKVYSNSKSDSNKAIEIIESLDLESLDSIGIDLIEYEAYKNNNDKNYKKYLKDAIEKAEDIDKDSYITYYLLSIEALENGKYDEALSNVKKSISINGSYLKSYSYVIPSIFINKGEFKAIEGYYRTAIEKEPFNYKLITDIANYYYNYESNDSKAEYYYELAIDIRKEDASLYKKIADLNIRSNNIEAAIENLEKAIEIDENNGDYYRVLGAIYLKNEDYTEGIEYTRKAYEINEKDVIALNNAAWYYLVVENDIQRSYENIKSAYEELPVGLSEENKNTIIENYNKLKEIYENQESLDTYDSSEILFNLIF